MLLVWRPAHSPMGSLQVVKRPDKQNEYLSSGRLPAGGKLSVQLYFIIVQSSILCTVSCVPPEQLRKSWTEREDSAGGKVSDCKRISYMRAKGFDKIEKTECGRREWRPSTMKKKKPLEILFIGNSHTYKNDMPLMVRRRVWFRGEVYLGDDPYWS